MKKMTALVLFLSFFAFQGVSFALTPAEAKKARFNEVKAIKEKQRLEREAEKKGPQASATGESNWSRFWKKEGERSGLGQSGNGVGTFVRNLNPAPFFKEQKEKYEARKAGAVK